MVWKLETLDASLGVFPFYFFQELQIRQAHAYKISIPFLQRRFRYPGLSSGGS